MELFAREPKQPLWIHCFMGVGRTGTLITALILKEKRRELTQENLQETLVNIIISCRKERAAEFVQTPVQAELLYQYGLSLIARTSP
jgi:protein tyrosine phosphatase